MRGNFRNRKIGGRESIEIVKIIALLIVVLVILLVVAATFTFVLEIVKENDREEKYLWTIT